MEELPTDPKETCAEKEGELSEGSIDVPRIHEGKHQVEYAGNNSS